jgi:hypothetical protein
MNNTKPLGKPKLMAENNRPAAAPDQHCSEIAVDGRFALPCCEQRQERGGARGRRWRRRTGCSR